MVSATSPTSHLVSLTASAPVASSTAVPPEKNDSLWVSSNLFSQLWSHLKKTKVHPIQPDSKQASSSFQRQRSLPQQESKEEHSSPKPSVTHRRHLTISPSQTQGITLASSVEDTLAPVPAEGKGDNSSLVGGRNMLQPVSINSTTGKENAVKGSETKQLSNDLDFKIREYSQTPSPDVKIIRNHQNKLPQLGVV